MPITKEQATHLRERISTAVAANRNRAYDQKPAAVAKAEQVVAAWEKAQDEKRSARAEKVRAAARDAYEAVLSGDWPTALAVVKKLEATKF